VSLEEELICSGCGADCCPACAFAVTAAIYCGVCAESILDAEGVPLAFSASSEWMVPRPGSLDRTAPGAKPRWIVLVARDQPDLFAHLQRAFARDPKVAVVADRRKDYARNLPGLEERLRIHGAAVIRRRQP